MEEQEHVDATKTQNKQPPSTKYESDTGTPDSKEDVEKDKKTENIETNKAEESKDKDKIVDERKTGLLTMTQPLDDPPRESNFKHDTRISAKSNSNGNPVNENGKRSKSITHELCEKSIHGESK